MLGYILLSYIYVHQYKYLSSAIPLIDHSNTAFHNFQVIPAYFFFLAFNIRCQVTYDIHKYMYINTNTSDLR